MLLLTHPILECSLRDLTFEQKKICPPWNWKLTLLALQWLRCLSFEVALLIIRVKENDNAFVRDIGLDASLFSASDKRSHMEYWNLTKHNFFRQTSLPLCHCWKCNCIALLLVWKGFHHRWCALLIGPWVGNTSKLLCKFEKGIVSSSCNESSVEIAAWQAYLVFYIDFTASKKSIQKRRKECSRGLFVLKERCVLKSEVSFSRNVQNRNIFCFS